jgi:hypothetical protein
MGVECSTYDTSKVWSEKAESVKWTHLAQVCVPWRASFEHCNEVSCYFKFGEFLTR